LLIVGATSIIKLARRGLKMPRWIESLMLRRPIKVISVALANKIARSIWAVLTKEESYRPAVGMTRA